MIKDIHVIVFWISFVSLVSGVGSETDPCVTHGVMDDRTLLTSYTTDTPICTPIGPSGWYRFVGSRDGYIADTCPSWNQCGTDTQIWMAGPVPSIRDGITNVVFCMRQQGECCRRRNTLYVKNCTSYIVFLLVDLPPCTRLCFRDENTTTSTLTTKEITTITTQPSTTSTLQTLSTGIPALQEQSITTITTQPSTTSTLQTLSTGIPALQEQSITTITTQPSTTPTLQTLSTGIPALHEQSIAQSSTLSTSPRAVTTTRPLEEQITTKLPGKSTNYTLSSLQTEAYPLEEQISTSLPGNSTNYTPSTLQTEQYRNVTSSVVTEKRCRHGDIDPCKGRRLVMIGLIVFGVILDCFLVIGIVYIKRRN